MLQSILYFLIRISDIIRHHRLNDMLRYVCCYSSHSRPFKVLITHCS